MLRKQCRTLVQIANLELRYVLVILLVNWPIRRNEFLPRGYISELVPISKLIHFIRDYMKCEWNFKRVALHFIFRFYLKLVSLPQNGIVFLCVRINKIDRFRLFNERNQAKQLLLQLSAIIFIFTHIVSSFASWTYSTLQRRFSFIREYHPSRLRFSSYLSVLKTEIAYVMTKLTCLAWRASHSHVEYFER